MWIAETLERTRRDAPDREAVVCGDVRFTYAQLGDRVDRLATALVQLGLDMGTRVAVLERNCHRYLEIYLAAARIGAVLVPLNYRLAARELVEILADSEAEALLVGTGFLSLLEAMRLDTPALKRIVVLDGVTRSGVAAYETLIREAGGPLPPMPTAPDELLALYYTSGTTGRSKGVMVGEGGVVLLAETLVEAMGLTSLDRYLHVGPMFHAAAPGTLLATTLAGGCVCLADFQLPRTLEVLQDEHVTVTNLVPTTVSLLVDTPGLVNYDLSALRLVVYGSAPMPEALTRRAMASLRVGLMQRYGLTEVLPVTYLLPKDHVPDGPELDAHHLRSVGRAVPGVQLRVVDEVDRDLPNGKVGEVIVRGPNVMLGYWKQPEATAEALRGGWMHTGDMGRLDNDGYLYLVDRKKDVIISGGENVYSTEVETVLYQHPAVFEAAVIGVPDSTWGEAVKAVVVLRAGQRVSSEDLRRFCREQIAGYKVPRSVDFVDAVPKTSTGKIDKKELRAPHWAAQPR